VALVAQYSDDVIQTRSLSEYLFQLACNGFLPVVISVCERQDSLIFPYGIPDSTVIIRRPNLGYDFGSWATALGCFPDLRTAEIVLLTNDSLLGPFTSIQHLLEWIAQPGPDIRGLTQSFQFVQHMQSFFLAFRGGVLADRPWRDFFNSVRVEPDKGSVVMSYEIGLSRLAFSEGYSVEPWVTGPELGVPFGNPTVDGWRYLIESGIPFLKRTIMTHPSTLSEAAEASAYVMRHFSQNVLEW
jgi:lipopolysaccharide biosynthesis protein